MNTPSLDYNDLVAHRVKEGPQCCEFLAGDSIDSDSIRRYHDECLEKEVEESFQKEPDKMQATLKELLKQISREVNRTTRGGPRAKKLEESAKLYAALMGKVEAEGGKKALEAVEEKVEDDRAEPKKKFGWRWSRGEDLFAIKEEFGASDFDT